MMLRRTWWALGWLGMVTVSLPAQTTTPPADVERIRAEAVPSHLYPNAAAVFLLDRRSLEVRGDGGLRVSIRQTIQILNERGHRYAEVQIPFNASSQKLVGYWARTLRPDGTVQTVPPETFRLAKLAPTYPFYADVAALMFSMPGAEPGVILDYEVTLEREKGILAATAFSDLFLMQAADPIRLSKYVLTLPKGLKFQVVLRNLDLQPQVEEKENTITYLWQRREAPGIPLEPNMPPFQDIASLLAVTSIPSWNDVAAWYADLSEPQYAANDALRAETENLLQGISSREEKIRRLFHFVQTKVRYVGIDLGRSAYQPHPATEVLEKQYGDCKDQATLLIAMLRVAGIQGYPALLRKRNTGRLVLEAPAPQQFNHLIVAVPKREDEEPQSGEDFYWLDPTVEAAPFGYLPPNLQGCEALVVRGRQASFFTTPVPRPEENRRRRHIRVQMEPNGSIWVEALLEEWGAFSQRTREAFLRLPPDRYAEEIEAGLNQTCPFARLEEPPQFSDLRAFDEPLRLRFRFRAPEYADLSARSLSFRASLLERLSTRSLLPDTRRVHPFVLPEGLLSENVAEILPPPGYGVAEMPADVDIEYPFGRFAVTYREQSGRILYTRVLLLRPAVIPPELYSVLREFYERIWNEDNKRLVVLRRR